MSTLDTRDDYLPAFLAEAREHLQELGLAIVRIEAAPDDQLAADNIFRVAHSLKGMSATMGFDAIVALTHAMEDVFELLRQRSGGLPPDAIDVLSACLDALETTVDQIGAGSGDELLDPASLVERLRRLARERTPAQELARDGDAALPDLTRWAGGDRAPGESLLHVVADLADACQMPAVRAFMLFEALRVHGELVGGVPAPDAVERFAGRRVEAWVATRADVSMLEESARAVGELADVRVREETLPTPDGASANDARADDAAVGEPASAASTPSASRGAGASVRVDAERLDELLHLIGELVQHRTTVEALAAEAAVPGLAPAIQRLARTSQALHETVTRVRMVPVESVFLRFPRLVRDLAARLGKQVELRLEGADTELDRSVVDALGDPLVHLVRNALDHGVETPAERVAAGKPPNGVLELSARHAGGHVIVAVRDDGRGIDPATIARAALTRGLLDEEAAAALDATSAVELLFAPGFTTASQTTDVSGRGVGMDAVRESVRTLGGDVTLTSIRGQGTRAQLRLPLTLASIAALLVTVDELPYAIPLDRVVRTVRLDALPVRTVRGAPLLPLGGELLPLLDGAAALGCDVARSSQRLVPGGRQPSPGAERAFAVIVNVAAGRRVALAVSSLAGQRELVTRRLPRAVSQRAAAAGGAVLPDGGIALVVDCDRLSDIDRSSPLAANDGRNPGQEGVPA
ncbi:MAG TPA: chemotaxis protein CheA [Conexibacter sp.]|nr:chemotaxis protein CheA [Conexibacter sp.]